MKLHHVDGPRVARELGHHLASSQIPELGQGGWRSGPPALPPVQPKLCPRTTFPSAQLGTATPRREAGTSLSVTSRRQAPALARVRPGATFTVWSSAADANHFPSGLNRRHRTAWLCP